MCFSFLYSASGKGWENETQREQEACEIRQSGQYVKGMFAQHFGGFDQGAIFMLPAAEKKKPMLDQCQQELSIDFTQYLVWQLGAPLIERQITFPQLEEEFNLPTETL